MLVLVCPAMGNRKKIQGPAIVAVRAGTLCNQSSRAKWNCASALSFGEPHEELKSQRYVLRKQHRKSTNLHNREKRGFAATNRGKPSQIRFSCFCSPTLSQNHASSIPGSLHNMTEPTPTNGPSAAALDPVSTRVALATSSTSARIAQLRTIDDKITNGSECDLVSGRWVVGA